MDYKLTIERPRPYFAEVPYYLWGAVNYDSEGDCKRPTDRDWTELELSHRDTEEAVYLRGEDSDWTITAEEPLAARAALFMAERCGAETCEPSPVDHIGDWNYEAAMARALRVAEEFTSPKLKIFDSYLFWVGWKWIGGLASEFASSTRMIMHSVLKGDPRGVSLCIDWLREGTLHEDESAALRAALHELTGETFDTDAKWVRWYDGFWTRAKVRKRFPKPELDAWLDELKSEYGDLSGNKHRRGSPS